MLIIRQEQIKTLGEGLLDRFETDLLERLRVVFPVDVALAGERALGSFVGRAVERARGYGLVTRGQISRYVDLALTFGTEFDRDPLLPWVRGSLSNQRLTDAGARMDRLEHLALRHFDRVEGEEGEHFQKAMLRARRLVLDDYRCEAEELSPALLALLERLHAQKVLNAPDDGLDEFVGLSREHIARSGLSPEHGALVVPALMFMLGSHAPSDPLFPWIAEVLAGDRAAGPGVREQALLDAAVGYLERALALMRRQEGA